MIRTRCGDLELVVDAHGGGIAGLYRHRARGRESLLLGYAYGEAREGGMGDVLAPFPNRLRGGRYAGPDGGGILRGFTRRGADTLHAFVRELPWTVAADGHGAVRAGIRVAAADGVAWGHPYDLAIAVRYALAPGRLTVAATVANPGARPCPAALGFHPYLALAGRLDRARLRLPGRRIIGFPPDRGRLLAAAPLTAFRSPERVGSTAFDHVLVDLERDARGRAWTVLAEPGRVLRLWVDAGFPFVQVFSADALRHRPRRGLAVEPCTATAFAFNGDGLGARWLAPGGRFQAAWGLVIDA